MSNAAITPNFSNETVPRTALYIAMNEFSGSDTNTTLSTINEHYIALGHAVTLCEIPRGSSIDRVCGPLVKQAVADGGIVVAVGGDGTVNALAKLCYTYGATLAVIPQGTFNYFARAVDIPTELNAALDVVSNGTVRTVSAGFVGDHLFLNNASFGLYPRLIKQREKATSRFGRKRFIAALSALNSIFYDTKTRSIVVKSHGETEFHRTRMVFVGNNTLQFQNLGLDVGECTKRDQLGVVIMQPMSRLEIVRLMWRTLVRNLSFESKLIQFCSDGFEVKTSKARIEVVIDGEIIRCDTPLQFRIEARAIRVIVPAGNIS